MFNNFKFNQSYRKIAKKSRYDKEFEVLHELNSSEYENVEFEYSTVQEAANARQAIVTYIGGAKMPLNTVQRKNFVYVVKVKKENA